MKHEILVVLFCLGSALTLPPKGSKHFRSDYEYSRKMDAYYKLHIDIMSYSRAVDSCKLEGAVIALPTSGDISQIHGMFKRFPDIGQSIWVGNDGKTHESAEEDPIIDLTPNENDQVHLNNIEFGGSCDVMTREGEIKSMACIRGHPFVCKVDAKDALQAYDEQCNVYGTGYKYEASVHSCYRVPPFVATWDLAYAECRAENAHLAVINSDAERDVIKEFLKTVPANRLARTTYFFFAGIRAARPPPGTTRVFKTIFNQTLEEAGFSGWSDGEPNNYQDTEYCGTIFSNNGKYNDVNCIHEYSFICEKVVAPK